MAKTSGRGIEAIADEVKKRLETAVKKTAEEVTFQIESAYERAIDKFYADYSPHRYRRTYSTYLGSSGSRSLFNKGNIKKIGAYKYRAGISVSAGNIPGNPYRAYDKDWVFTRTFQKGYHGYKMAEAKQWTSDNPITQSYRFQKSTGVWGFGLSGDFPDEVWKTGRYQFHWVNDGNGNNMKVMKPAPAVLVERDVRKIYKSVGKIFNGYFS